MLIILPKDSYSFLYEACGQMVLGGGKSYSAEHFCIQYLLTVFGKPNGKAIVQSFVLLCLIVYLLTIIRMIYSKKEYAENIFKYIMLENEWSISSFIHTGYIFG